MAKFSGMIGYGKQVEVAKGVWEDVVEERFAKGDLLNEVYRHSAPKVNEDISVTNRISIVAGKFVKDNMFSMVYIMMYGKPWKVSTVEIQGNRLVINVGGLYNGELAN